MSLLKFVLTVVFLVLLLEQSFAEQMTVNKIVLSRFKVKNDNLTDLVKSDPYWPKIDRHNLTVDDNENIYVLNLLNREIILFDNSGKVYKKIALPIESIKGKIDDYGALEVSGDGKRIFVNIPSQGRYAYEPDFIPGKGLILNDKGEIIKQTGFPEIHRRLCNKTYVNLQAPYYYDENFSLIGGYGDDRERLSRLYLLSHTDSNGEYYDIEKRSLIKYANDGKKVWKKQFDEYFRIIGIDINNYVYIEGVLRKGDPNTIYKLNSKGEIIAQVPIPDPFPFITQEEKDAWDAHSSEEFLSFFKLACNGDVYLIYQLGELPSLTFQRWLRGGEYFIYKFEVKK